MLSVRKNSHGISHIILPVIIVLLVGAIGVYVIKKGKADQVGNTVTNTTTTIDTSSSAALDIDSVAPTFSSSGTLANVQTADGTIMTSNSSGPGGCWINTIAHDCHLWAGGGQTLSPNNAGGVSATITQANPNTTPSRYTFNEIWISSATNNKQAIEFGWYTKGDTTPSGPYMMVGYWVDGHFKGFNNNNFKVNPNYTGPKLGHTRLSFGNYNYRVQFIDGQWKFYHAGQYLGHFDESLWGGRFTTIGNVQLFGEVTGSTVNKAQSQMGNGIFGHNAGSAAFTDISLINTNSTINLYHFATNKSAYDYGLIQVNGATSKHGFRFGGPGF